MVITNVYRFIFTLEEGKVVIGHVYMWQGFLPLHFPGGHPSGNQWHRPKLTLNHVA